MTAISGGVRWAQVELVPGFELEQVRFHADLDGCSSIGTPERCGRCGVIFEVVARFPGRGETTRCAEPGCARRFHHRVSSRHHADPVRCLVEAE